MPVTLIFLDIHFQSESTHNGGICPPGYYCEEGTANPYLTPCENGTYSNHSGGQNMDDCLDCPPGEVCNGVALTAPNDLCAPGECIDQ